MSDLKMYDVVFKNREGRIGKWQRFATSLEAAKESAREVVDYEFGGRGALISVRRSGATHPVRQANKANKAKTNAPRSRSRLSASERLFKGVYPEGIVYADRSREVNGDYRKLAFLPFGTLVLEWWDTNVPPDVAKLIEIDARALQARRGEQFQVSGSGQTRTLGGSSSNRARPDVDEARRMRLPDAWTQSGSRAPIMLHDLEVYTWEGTSAKTGQPYYAAMAFVGNQGKPIEYGHYKTPEIRDAKMIDWMKTRRYVAQQKKTTRQERGQFVPLKVGDILETSYGYDQTNIDFYEVIAVRGAKGMTVDLQEIGSSVVANTPGAAMVGEMGRQMRSSSDMVIPDPTSRGKVILGKRMQGYRGHGYVRMSDSRGMATLWNGQPQYQTAAGYGH